MQRLKELDQKTADGLKATAFWVREGRAYIRFNEGTEVGPFEYGTHWGEGADPDLLAKLAGRLFRYGFMQPARSEAEAAVMLRDATADQVNQVFPPTIAAWES